MEPPAQSSKEHVLELVRRHGWNATSFQTLESGFRYFFHGGDACVAYVDTGSAWVAAGAPIAKTEDLDVVARAFASAAQSRGKRCCFFAIEDRFRIAAGASLRSLRIGEQPVWDPREWQSALARRSSLREQLRRARAKGVRIREVPLDELQREAFQSALLAVANRWLATRALARMGFLVHLEPFTHPAHRRCFVAELEGRIIAFAGVIPVPARPGWFLEDLVRDPAAPNGTAELLVDAVMTWAAAQTHSSWLTLGLAPLAGEVGKSLRVARRATLLYDFAGLRKYKAKLEPQSWSPIHLCYPGGQSSVLTVVDALSAFARGGLFRFAVRSVFRGPIALLRLVTLALVPWTLLLALAPAEHWFGTELAKWSWVVFNVCLTAGMLHTIRQGRRWQFAILASIVSADAVLTTIQAAFWNLPRSRSAAESALVVLACAAPTVVAAMLWGAWRTRLKFLPHRRDLASRLHGC